MIVEKSKCSMQMKQDFKDLRGITIGSGIK